VIKKLLELAAIKRLIEWWRNRHQPRNTGS
jgi:hypothetical protein